jgi:short-subunit dehydrogenase
VEVRDKVAIVTGASGGIGLATARLLAARGAKVALVARSANRLEQLAGELPDSFAVPTDVRDAAAVTRMITAVRDHYGRVDILVNNAGRGLHVPIERIDIADFQQVMELNVFGPLVAMQAVIPLMRAQGGGAIVNVSSMVSKMYIPGLAGYAATKYALNALSLTARKELAADNIVVGVVYPRVTATDFARNAIGSAAPRPAPAPGQPATAHGGQPIDTAEMVAAKILAAIETGAAETYMTDEPPAPA